MKFERAGLSYWRRISRLVAKWVRRWIAQFRRNNAHAPGTRAELGQKFTIDELKCLDGFYDPERSPSEQWRWTGPGNSFSIFLPIDRSRARSVTLEVLHSPSAFNWENTFLEWDNGMALSQHHNKDGRHFMTNVLPVQAGGSSVILRYHVQETRKPEEGGDGRLLGMRVLAVYVR